MSKLHCQTSRSFRSGSNRHTLTGGAATAPTNGSFSVRIGRPERNWRVGEPATASVIESYCWKPDSGGIRLAVLICTKCCGLVYCPAPIRMTHLLEGR